MVFVGQVVAVRHVLAAEGTEVAVELDTLARFNGNHVFLADGGPGVMVEVGPTSEIFARPKDKRTENYVTGRFG